jgi:CheY-like chemotaxis protein
MLARSPSKRRFVPLKILLADDSMTAQRLGKEYLVAAGHEVTAVSNGAAAMKKIAEIKPNLIVLDVYMPGYSGLEVCEKVKAAKETAAIPVLLTYAAMEPFKPEDGNRVKADGVLVKPFDQAVLVAAVKRIEQKLKPAEPEYEKTIKLTADQIRGFQEDASFQAWAATAEAVPDAEAAEPAEAQISVPKEMAAAPAFGLEDLLGETPAAPAPPAPAFEAPAPPQPAFTMSEPEPAASPAELSFEM